MIATDAVNRDRTIGDTWTCARLTSASAGSLAFLAGHLGTGLGWHGWHSPVASYDPPVTFDRVEMLEALR